MLLPLAIAFLAGLVLGSYLPYLPSVALLILALTAAVLTRLEYLGRMTVRQSTVVYGALSAGLIYWTVFSWATSGSNLMDRAGSNPIKCMGVIVEPVQRAPGRTVMALSMVQLGEGHAAVPVRGKLRLTWREPDRTFRQGDQVAFLARVRAPSGTMNPGGFDFGAYLNRHGIDAVASVSGPGQVTLLSSATLPSRWVFWGAIDEWRARIHQAAVSTLDGPALGIYLGIILGEPGYLAPEVRDAFMTTGTIHILSISGSHLGLIALLSFFLVKWTCLHLPATWLQTLSRRTTPTRLAALITIAPVTFYALLAGAEVATVRSLVMIYFFLLAVWLGREGKLVLSLAGAALVILVHDPRALYDISFQLSYLSVLAIALVAHWRSRSDPDGSLVPNSGTRRFLPWIRDYIWISVGITLTTLPLVAYHFNQMAWLGLGANPIVVPLAGFAVVPVGLGSAIWLLLTGGDTLPAGPVNQFLLDLMAGAVRQMARFPGAEWHVASPAIPAIAGFYGMLYAASRLTGSARVRWGCTFGTLAVIGWWAWSPRGLDNETLRVTFLDVGQGDACVVELPDGQTVLLDAGASYDTLDMGRVVVGPYLWDRGIRRLDHVIGTHPQLDHVGGLPWILRTFEIGRYWGNGIERDEEFFRRIRNAVHERNMTESRAEEGQLIISSGPCRLHVLNPLAMKPLSGSPVANLNAKSGTALNNLSVVTKLDCGPHSFLFTADIETATLSRLSDAKHPIEAHVLKVPHHGARSSLDIGWIGRVHPDVAVISVGRHNSYGHPSAAVLNAYQKDGVKLFRTDRHGAVWVTAKVSSPHLEIHVAREDLPRPVHVGPSLVTAERQNLAKLWSQWMGP